MSKEEMEEHEKLKDFLAKIEEDLAYCVKKVVPGIIEMRMLPFDLRTSIENAWIEIDTIFSNVSERIDDIDISELHKVGLSGVELNFKIAIFNSLHYKFREVLSQEIFKKLLKSSSSILESLSLNIFSVNRIIGFKESIESLLL